MEDFVQQELIFMTVAGSRMYGTNTPESDVDKRGVCVPPRNVVMGFARSFNQQNFEGEDTVVYSLMKFVQLCVDNNPNIIELLFAPDDCVQVCHPTWEKLRERRDEFISAKCYHSFSGFAHSNLKRLKRRRDRRNAGSGEPLSSKELKHAMHVIRILRMCEEILTQGVVQVQRPDFKELLAIRNGEVPLEKIFEEADVLDARLAAIYESKAYVVPFSPPKILLSDFCVELHDDHWSRKG